MDPQPLKGREKRGLVSDWTHQLTSFVRAASRYANSSNNTTDKEARSQRIIYIQSILPLIKVSFAPSVGFKFSKIMLHANQTSVRISLLSAWKKRNMAVFGCICINIQKEYETQFLVVIDNIFTSSKTSG